MRAIAFRHKGEILGRGREILTVRSFRRASTCARPGSRNDAVQLVCRTLYASDRASRDKMEKKKPPGKPEGKKKLQNCVTFVIGARFSVSERNGVVKVCSHDHARSRGQCPFTPQVV